MDIHADSKVYSRCELSVGIRASDANTCMFLLSFTALVEGAAPSPGADEVLGFSTVGMQQAL